MAGSSPYVIKLSKQERRVLESVDARKWSRTSANVFQRSGSGASCMFVLTLARHDEASHTRSWL